MPTPKYHIYIEYAEPDKSGIRFNMPHEELVRIFSEPFHLGKPFWFMGRLLNPIKVAKAIVFWSYETADQLRLPSQENLVSAKDKKFLIENIVKGKVKGAYLCTEEFLPPTEKNLAPAPSATPASGAAPRRILVVSGTDDVMKQALLKALTRLHLAPVVMHEEPSQGRKIVERFADYADAGFAVVLLSPDVYVYPKGEEATKRERAPKQDVIFMLGFLLGKLGKGKVLVFFKESQNFAFPMDFEGVKFTAFDDRDSWKLALIRELTNCGYTVDPDRILK